MKRQTLCLVLGIASATSMVSIQAQSFDITGIKIGASYDEVLSKMTADGYHLSRVKFPWPDMLAAFASRKLPHQEGFTIQAVNGKVVYLDHTASFAQGSGPNTQETISAAKSKYGLTPSSGFGPEQSGNGSIGLVWEYDANGNVHPGRGNQSLSCQVERDVVPNAPDAIDGLLIAKYVPAWVNCGKTVDIRVFPDRNNTQIVGTVKGTIADQQTLRSFFAEKAKESQSTQNKQGSEAKKVKPPI